MSFNESMAMADGALFEEMGESIQIGGVAVPAIRQPDDVTSTAAEGGFAREATARFEISLADFIGNGIKLGQKVQQGAAQWRIASLRHKGGTMELICAATSGQGGGRAEF
jgi:hypothetical protein